MKRSYANPDHHVSKLPENAGKKVLSQESDIRAGTPAYRIKPGYVLREFLGEYLIIPVGSAKVTGNKVAILNPVGQFLWDMLQEQKTMEDLIRAVTDEFEVSAEEAKGDIEEFLQQLDEFQFLQ